LLDRRIIKGHLFAGYKASGEKPEDRKTLTEQNRINDVNSKLIEIYETS